MNTKAKTHVSINKLCIYSIITLVILFIIIFIVNSSVLKTMAQNHKTDYKYYTSIVIEDNDTLWSIADNFAGSENKQQYINNIMSINNMTQDTIYEGQNLLIYYYSDEYK